MFDHIPILRLVNNFTKDGLSDKGYRYAREAEAAMDSVMQYMDDDQQTRFKEAYNEILALAGRLQQKNGLLPKWVYVEFKNPRDFAKKARAFRQDSLKLSKRIETEALKQGDVKASSRPRPGLVLTFGNDTQDSIDDVSTLLSEAHISDLKVQSPGSDLPSKESKLHETLSPLISRNKLSLEKGTQAIIEEFLAALAIDESLQSPQSEELPSSAGTETIAPTSHAYVNNASSLTSHQPLRALPDSPGFISGSEADRSSAAAEVAHDLPTLIVEPRPAYTANEDLTDEDILVDGHRRVFNALPKIRPSIVERMRTRLFRSSSESLHSITDEDRILRTGSTDSLHSDTSSEYVNLFTQA